jgi:hypothetical protein
MMVNNNIIFSSKDVNIQEFINSSFQNLDLKPNDIYVMDNTILNRDKLDLIFNTRKAVLIYHNFLNIDTKYIVKEFLSSCTITVIIVTKCKEDVEKLYNVNLKPIDTIILNNRSKINVYHL